MRSVQVSFIVTPRKAAVLAVLALSILCLGFTSGGCSASQRNKALAGTSTALTGHADPAATQPATPGSIIGVTQGIEAGAGAVASVPSPLQTPFALIAQLAALAVVVERLTVYGLAAIKNFNASPSDSTSESATGSKNNTQPAGNASGSGSPQSNTSPASPPPPPALGIAL